MIEPPMRDPLKDAQLRQGIAQIRQRYLEQLPAMLATITEAWQALVEHGWEETPARTLYQKLHSLAGTGATLGLDIISSHASDWEHRLIVLLDAHQTPSTAELIAMGVCYGRLQQAYLHRSADTAAGDEADNDNDPPIAPEADLSLISPPDATDAPDGKATPLVLPPALAEPDNRRVYLFADDLDMVQELVPQLGYFGYLARCFDDLNDLLRAVQRGVPVAIVRDIRTLRHSPDASLHGPSSTPVIPTMFLAEQGEFALRLEAVRAGGQAYFTYPVDVGTLVDRLDDLTVRRQPEPYRILIIEDDPHAIQIYTTVLQSAGMVTESLTDPLQVMRPLVEFNPDLILMDVYMPGCTGLEVAAVIRQQEAFVGVPIVFLSAEKRLDRQLTAMHQGGDDFLHKSISDDHLISAVSSRAQRSRALRASMSRDGLTGLLNHTSTKEHLERELRIAQRRSGQFVFALIDLDHFKQVNDTYGHSTGDRVLKSLARLLQQRLRRTDLVGRYGGEEFAVIMLDTDGTHAAQVLNDVREKFARFRQRADQYEFAVTLSCGVACYPVYGDADVLSRAADNALYRAKRNGRNQVVLATDPLTDLLP
ncbi:MAG: diguanylate cyclase [Chloroflexaceae bacterium]|nr:diguanylate cyclase [Chloroflexaceae bacterium]